MATRFSGIPAQSGPRIKALDRRLKEDRPSIGRYSFVVVGSKDRDFSHSFTTWKL